MAGFNTLEMALIKAQQKAAEKAAKRAAKEAAKNKNIDVKKIYPEPREAIPKTQSIFIEKQNTRMDYDDFDSGFGGGGQPTKTHSEYYKHYGKDQSSHWENIAESIGVKSSSVNPVNGDRLGIMGNLKGAWSGMLNWMDDGFQGGAKGVMPSIIGAGIGGTYGFVGNFFAPDNVQVQNPMRSALMGAAAGFGLGALGGAAGGVKAVNKANQGFMYHAANRTQKVAKGTTASVAIGIAAYAGSKDTSYTKPLNRNSHI